MILPVSFRVKINPELIRSKKYQKKLANKSRANWSLPEIIFLS